MTFDPRIAGGLLLTVLTFVAAGRAADVVRVPAGMPHQFLVADGQQITFTMTIVR